MAERLYNSPAFEWHLVQRAWAPNRAVYESLWLTAGSLGERQAHRHGCIMLTIFKASQRSAGGKAARR